MKITGRRSTPKVRGGKVQKKNNATVTGNYWCATMPWLVFDRRRPGPGHRHLLDAWMIRDFLQLVPEWETFRDWLNAIVLDEKDPDRFGWHSPGVIGICAWPRDLWTEWAYSGFELECPLLDLLGVPYECFPDENRVLCKFTENTAKGHQLLGTLLHEIGHHLDRLTTRNKVKACRGEPFAREYAWLTAQLIFDRYCERFEL
jgi:hypothetical protein